MSSKKLLSVEPPAGRVLKEGKLKRSVKKLFGTSLVSAHVVLTSDPILCVYDDEQKAKLKASYKLAKGTTIHCQVATDIIVSIPTSDSKKESVTFKSDDVAESMAWRTALSNVIQRAYGLSQQDLRSPSKQTLLEKSQGIPKGGIKEETQDSVPDIVKQLKYSSKMQSSGQLMGGVELGGGGPPLDGDPEDDEDEDEGVAKPRRRMSSTGIVPPPTSRAFSSKLLNAFSAKMEQSQTSIQRSRVSLSNGDPAKATNELLEAVSVMEMVSRDDGKGAKDSGEQKRRHPATDALVQAIFELDGTHIDLTDGATRETGSNSMASLLSAVNELQQEVSEEARLLGDIGGRGPAMDDEEAERAAKAFVGVGGSATSKLMEAMSSLEAESFMSFDIVTTVATTPSEMNALERRVFEKYDMNRSGDIDGDELREALSDLGLITDTSQAERLMRKYDVDRSGALELEEFVTLTKELRAFKESSESGATAAILRAVATMEAISIGGAEKATDDTSATKLLRAVADMEAIVQAPSSHERAPAFVEEDAEDNPYAYEDWKMFQKYDTNRSGDIDAAELRHALKDLGLKTDGVLSETVLRKYDTDHSGALELEEFAKLVKELRAFQRVNATTKLLNAVSAMEADERLAALARQNEASRIPGKKRRVTVSAQAALTEATDGMHKASAAPRRTRVDSLPPPPSLPPKSGDRPAFDWPEGNLVVIRRGFLNKDNPNGSFHNVAFGLNIEQKGMNKVVTRGPQYFLNETDATLGGGDAPTSDQIGIRNPVEVGANGQVVEVHRIEETIATHVAQHFGASADIGAMRSWFPPQLLKSNATLQWDEWGGMFAPGTVMTRLPIEVECRGHHATSYAFRQDVSTLAQMEAARQKQSQALVPLIDIGDESQFPPKEAHWSLVIDKETKRPLQCIRTSIVALPFSLDPEWGTAEEREEKGLPFRRGACTCETTIDTFFWDASVPPPEEDDGRCLAVLGYDVADLMKIIDDIWRPLGVHPLFELNTCDPVNEDDDGEEYFHPDLTDPA